MNTTEKRLEVLEARISGIKDPVSQKIIDLKLENMSQSIKLDIQDSLARAHEKLEIKINEQIKDAISKQKEKISWGLELLRFSIVAIMFIVSIKTVIN